MARHTHRDSRFRLFWNCGPCERAHALQWHNAYTEQLYVGECGHTYAFYSVARDHVGSLEPQIPSAQAQITVLPNTPPVLEPIEDRVIHVGQYLVITNVATDMDSPPQPSLSALTREHLRI